PCTVNLALETGSVFTNESFQITVNVARDAGAPPLYGGNIAITVPEESIVLASYMIPNGFYLDLSVALDVPIPLWFSPGPTEMTAIFTDTQNYFASATEPFMLDILALGHEIALTVTPDTINREDEEVTIRVDFAGDSAVGKTLRVGWTNEVTNWTIATRTVTNNPELILWAVNYSFTPGSYQMWVELREPTSGTIYATHDQSVTLFDYVAFEWTITTTTPAPGETVEFSFACSQQDIPTLAVPSRILITDSAEGSIGNVTTDGLGMVDFIWDIPGDTLAGFHSLNFTVIPLDPNAGFVQQTFWESLLVQGQTLLQLSYPIQVQRGKTLEINYQLSVEGQGPVTDGEIYFNPPNDPVQMQPVDAAGNGFFTLNVSLDHPVGLHSFTISFAGTLAFSPVEETIDIRILSEPHFSTLHINASPVLPGQTLHLFGELLDEVDTGVADQEILFYWSETISIGSALTQADGTFAYNWEIPPDAAPGLNILSVEFPGNISAGYLAPLNQPATIAVLISNDIALEVPASVITNTRVTLKIHGGYGTNTSVWWQENGGAEWHLIVANLSITSVATPYELLWSVPAQRGPITLRMTNSLGLIVFATTIAYEEAVYTFPTDLALEVDEVFLLNASCSATYRILVDGIPVTSWGTTPSSLSVSFALRGLHTLTMEIADTYVVEQTLKATVSVYEPVTITTLVPSTITANTPVAIGITVTSALPGGTPLSGKQITVSVDDLVRSAMVAEYALFLDATGSQLIETDALARGSYEIRVQLLEGQDWFAPTADNVKFYAVGSATLEFTPPPIIFFNEPVILSATLREVQGPIEGKTIGFLAQVEGEGWLLLGENRTSATGDIQLSWTPVLLPGKNYSLKAELKGSSDLEPIAVLKLIMVATLPPEIKAIHSSLPASNDTVMIAPGDYEIVVEVQEKSPLDYEVTLLVNGEQTPLASVDSSEYLFQADNEPYWITANDTRLYVGTVTCLADGIYTVVIKATDDLGAKSTIDLGVFAIAPPTIVEVWSLLPKGKEMLIVTDYPYVLVAQVQEHSPMNFAVYLVINGQRTEMVLNPGEGYTLQAPDGTSYFIPANGTQLFVGQLEFAASGTYDIDIIIEDERGGTQSWDVIILEVTLVGASTYDNASSANLNTNDGERNAIESLFALETGVLLLLMVGSSGTVVFVGRPRRPKL
ncbi:MAG: hypothetical protein ACFFB3_00370, partial [Candidatus Hodarchaeota archaeon]